MSVMFDINSNPWSIPKIWGDIVNLGLALVLFMAALFGAIITLYVENCFEKKRLEKLWKQ